MKDLKITQKELKMIENELDRLVGQQSEFEYSEKSTEEWNALQERIRELCVLKNKLQK